VIRVARLSVLAMGFAFLSLLSGCTAEDWSIDRFVSPMAGDSFPLSADDRRELQRFDSAFAESANGATRDERRQHFVDAFTRVRAEYVRDIPASRLIDAAVEGMRTTRGEKEAVAPEELAEAALDAMVESLDPHTVYLNAEEFREMRVSTSGEFGGLGIEVTLEDGGVKVIAPIEGTPAYRAGLKPGDIITHLDAESVAGLSLMQAVIRMRGKPGTDIRLTVQRTNFPPFKVTITRAIITLQSVRWRLYDDIAVIRVASFTEKVESGLYESIDAIRAELGTRLRGVVLDLRNNPGGLLDQSVELADAFLDSGTIVSIRSKGGADERFYSARYGDVARDVAMVVLINVGSASASEIVAGALQDNGRATVMGVRSFGKGTVQTIMPLPLEGAIRITTALYYAPSGQAIQAKGVNPDIAFAVSADANIRREADIPGALSAQEASEEDVRAARPVVDDSACPLINDGDDHQLGCALALLRAGSRAEFLASMGEKL
jgi:carboxyl-terminal processing protease